MLFWHIGIDLTRFQVEVLLYVWIAAFAYDEFGEFRDAGVSFYVADFWSLWDIGIIGIGLAYMVSSE